MRAILVVEELVGEREDVYLGGLEVVCFVEEVFWGQVEGLMV